MHKPKVKTKGSRTLGCRWLPMILILLLAACNHEPKVTEIDYAGTEGGTIFMLTQADGANGDTADLLGVLQLNEGCFQIAHEATEGSEPANIVWAEGFDVVADGESISILDTAGRAVTRVGERTLLGGSGGVEDPDRLGKCDGLFWYAGHFVTSGDAIPAVFD